MSHRHLSEIDLFRTIYTIRAFENRCIKLYRRGLIRGYFHPYLGEEAIAVGICSALTAQDYIVSTHRGHGHCIARGANLGRMAAELLGRTDGYCGGRGGSMHIADFARGNLGANGIVAGGIAMGVGAALGAKLRGEDRVCAIFFSDGAANNGVFPESLNLAAIWDLPAIFVLENNQYAVSTPIEDVCRIPELHRRGDAYGVANWCVDGNDVMAVRQAAETAVQQCRTGQGPVLLECKTFRHMGHHVNDPGQYMSEEKVEYYRTRDPIDMCRQQLLETGAATPAQLEAIIKEVDQEIEEAVAFAMQSPEPSVSTFLAAIEVYA